MTSFTGFALHWCTVHWSDLECCDDASRCASTVQLGNLYRMYKPCTRRRTQRSLGWDLFYDAEVAHATTARTSPSTKMILWQGRSRQLNFTVDCIFCPHGLDCSTVYCAAAEVLNSPQGTNAQCDTRAIRFWQKVILLLDVNRSNSLSCHKNVNQ